MSKRLLMLFMLSLALIAVPTIVSAADPGEHPRSDRPTVDWKTYPSDIQALKVKLDDIRSEQKVLFQQIRSQHEQLKSARKALKDNPGKTLNKEATAITQQMKASREEIHKLRSQKHEAWNSFYEQADNKQWGEAKSSLEAIVRQKEEILKHQQGILKLQQQLIKLINPAQQSHVHAEG
jgi:hypothetical protein